MALVVGYGVPNRKMIVLLVQLQSFFGSTRIAACQSVGRHRVSYDARPLQRAVAVICPFYAPRAGPKLGDFKTPRTKRSERLAQLRDIEATMLQLGILVGSRWRGRKPGKLER